MYSFMGTGITLYGEMDADPKDGSYVSTQWFTVLLFPIIPLGSFRVLKGGTATSGVPGVYVHQNTQYHMRRVSFHWKQIGITYLAVYGSFGLLALILWYLFNSS